MWLASENNRIYLLNLSVGFTTVLAVDKIFGNAGNSPKIGFRQPLRRSSSPSCRVHANDVICPVSFEFHSNNLSKILLYINVYFTNTKVVDKIISVSS